MKEMAVVAMEAAVTAQMMVMVVAVVEGHARLMEMVLASEAADGEVARKTDASRVATRAMAAGSRRLQGKGMGGGAVVCWWMASMTE